MVTCSHGIPWKDRHRFVTFTPGYLRGHTLYTQASAEHIIVLRELDGTKPINDNETAFDYAVVVLDAPLGLLTGWVGFRTYRAAWNGRNSWQNVGYPADLTAGEQAVFSAGGAIASAESQTFLGATGFVLGHFMDTSPGHSGGPYWGWWPGETGPRVVGIDSAGAARPKADRSGDDNEAAGGPALTFLINYARMHFP